MTDRFAEQINALPGWLRAMDITIVTATADEVSCHWEVAEKHLQGFGIVHGGVHCGVIESLCSIGAAAVAQARGQRVAGLENNTSFIRAVRSGRLSGLARPLTRGRTTQVWESWIRDEGGNLVAQGRVRLACFAAERELG
ncbi:MAG: PaaI family thioesterase [Proteobacteria bacterium]|nr:PaaI family thioesterase [Pseudomonadota bacterium]